MVDAKSVWSLNKIVETIAEFSYIDSRACVRVGNDVSEWFPVNVRLRLGCVMSPWLFNVWKRKKIFFYSNEVNLVL